MSLITAVEEGGSPSEIKKLIAAEDINQIDQYGCTALFYAAEAGNEEMVDILLLHEAKVNQQNTLKETPLMRAVIKKHYTIAEKLLHAEADPNIQNRDGYTSVHMAALNNDLQFMQLLAQHTCDTSIKTKNGDTVMHCAATGVTTAAPVWGLVEWLLRQGVASNEKNKDGISVTDTFGQEDQSYVKHYEKLVSLIALDSQASIDN